MRQPLSARPRTAYGLRALQPRWIVDLGYHNHIATTATEPAARLSGSAVCPALPCSASHPSVVVVN